jgi:hypothetical protein
LTVATVPVGGRDGWMLRNGLHALVVVCALIVPLAPALPDPHVEEQEKERRTDAPAPAPDMYPMPDPGLPPGGGPGPQ